MGTRNVFITGGTGSLGRTLVEKFAKSGYNVTFQYSRNEAVARELEQKFSANSMRIDVLTDTIPSRMDFDVLINNAGVILSRVFVQKKRTLSSLGKYACH